MSGPMAAPADQAVRLEVTDPQHSFIVQAPAGSGKTELLTQRFLRLLAIVERPQQVLAITFTRKATREMLDRILDRLRDAQAGKAPKEPHKKHAHQLALVVLERDREQGWDLLGNPGQLQVHTIDGLCARLVARGSGQPQSLSGLSVVENTIPLYVEAARRTIDQAARAEQGDACRAALESLLIRLRGDANRVQQLLAEALPRRDQWLTALLGSPGAVQQTDILRQLQRQELAALEAVLGKAELRTAVEAVVELAALADEVQPDHPLLSIAPSVLEQASADSSSGRSAGPPDPVSQRTQLLWHALSALASSTGAPYAPSSVNARVFKGANPARAPWVEVLAETLAAWKASQAALVAFRRFVKTPPLDLGTENDRLLADMRQLLLVACAELNVHFADSGVCDFQHVAALALESLGDEEAPGEALLIEDGRLEHILVDEFQDTSQLQFQLLEKLLTGWESEPQRTLFLVGDPMQSIYAFRKADVELFRAVAAAGRLGPVTLALRQLEVNFRSRSELVETVNRCAAAFFQAPSRVAPGHVDFTPSSAFQGAGGTVDFSLWQREPAGGDRAAEAAAIARRIETLLAKHGATTVGILTRKRELLEPVAEALQARQISFEAVEVESLEKRPVVLDLLTITRALLHPGDRVAWLGLLTAPWCALQPEQLLQIAGGSNRADLAARCRDDARLTALEPTQADRVRTLGEVMGVMQSASVRDDLDRRVEAAWVALGGPRLARRDEDFKDVAVFLRLLGQLAREQPDQLLVRLEHRLKRLYAGARSAAVKLMTIHKAKGLEFDAVFLPGLAAGSSNSANDLFRQRELLLPGNARGVLIAPTKSSGEAGPTLYDYLGLLQREESLSEAQRLLYVAMTRARRWLYLSAVVKLKINGGFSRAQGTFLGMLEQPFGRALDRIDEPFPGSEADLNAGDEPGSIANSEPVIEAAGDGSGAVTASNSQPGETPVPLQRLLPATPSLPLPAAGSPTPLTLGDPPPDRDRLALGQAFHEWLELIHDHWGEAGGAWRGDWYESRSVALRSSLLAAGARRASVEPLVTQLAALLRGVLECEELRNALSPADKAASFAEAVYLVPEGQRLKTLIVDRLYQDQDGLWHVVDYKTGKDAVSTRARWREQLGGYADTVAAAEQGTVARSLILQVDAPIAAAQGGGEQPAPPAVEAGSAVGRLIDPFEAGDDESG